MKKIVLCLTVLLSYSIASLADKAILLADDRDALQARIDLIQQAKFEILAEYFSVWNDDQSIGGLALLIEAAQRGVKVKIIVDSLSNTIPRALFATLLQKGKDLKTNEQNLEILVYNQLSLNLFLATYRDHAKILLADGKRVISGGRNVGDKYFGLNKNKNFHDLDIFAEGEVATQARENFFKVWHGKQTGHVALYEYEPKNISQYACQMLDNDTVCELRKKAALQDIEDQHERLKKMLITIQSTKKSSGSSIAFNTGKDWLQNVRNTVSAEFVSQNPEKFNSADDNTLTDRLAETLLNAKIEADIVSPYLIPTPRFYDILNVILARGVKVKIITNSLNSTDNVFAQAGYRAHKQRLIEMGVEIYEYIGPNTIHAKTAVIDHRIALVGTYNIDPRSAFINREVGIFVTDTSGLIIQDLAATIETFRSRSFLVAKDKVEYNMEKEFKGVSEMKKLELNAVKLILPLIESLL